MPDKIYRKIYVKYYDIFGFVIRKDFYSSLSYLRFYKLLDKISRKRLQKKARQHGIPINKWKYKQIEAIWNFPGKITIHVGGD